jgi:hypothetical protein
MSDINSFMRLHHVEVPGTPGIKLVPFAILDRPMRRLVLVSLIDCYVVQLSQVFMLRVFPVGTNY